MAVAHSILEFQQQPDNSPMSSYIWDISNSTNPEFELIPQSQLTSINFNLKLSLAGRCCMSLQHAWLLPTHLEGHLCDWLSANVPCPAPVAACS